MSLERNNKSDKKNQHDRAHKPESVSPVVSIVIPALNEADVIESTLHDLKSDKRASLDAEIIVVDGGSHDHTAFLAQRAGACVVQSRPGRAAQMNRGAYCARGQWLLFLHADTQLPRGLSNDFFSQMPDHWLWGRFDLELSKASWPYGAISHAINWRSRVSGVATGDQAMFVRRDVFFSMGGFKNMALMEDVELSKRLKALAKPNNVRSRVTTSSRRWEKNGVVSTVVLMWGLRMAFYCGVSPHRLARCYR